MLTPPFRPIWPTPVQRRQESETQTQLQQRGPLGSGVGGPSGNREWGDRRHEALLIQ